jgi:hypothetical protein
VPKVLVLYCDYGIEWPLWLERRGPRGPVDANHLQLSESTKARMRAWFNAYLGNERPDWPLWTAPEGATVDEDEEAWVAEGAAIRDLIQSELGRAYRVEYRT